MSWEEDGRAQRGLGAGEAARGQQLDTLPHNPPRGPRWDWGTGGTLQGLLQLGLHQQHLDAVLCRVLVWAGGGRRGWPDLTTAQHLPHDLLHPGLQVLSWRRAPRAQRHREQRLGQRSLSEDDLRGRVRRLVRVGGGRQGGEHGHSHGHGDGHILLAEMLDPDVALLLPHRLLHDLQLDAALGDGARLAALARLAREGDVTLLVRLHLALVDDLGAVLGEGDGPALQLSRKIRGSFHNIQKVPSPC